MERRRRILVTALDWGLGHATRCVPIIRELLANNCEVMLASAGEALALLKKEFPELKSFELPAYNPVYSQSNAMIFKMAMQLPKFIKTIRQEHVITEQLVSEHNIDVVISDNRYGCYSKKVKSVFIAHQLTILMPFGWDVLELLVNIANVKRIQNFTECWVPDVSGKHTLAGKMAINRKLKVRHIGPLSRLKKMDMPVKYDLMILASGPEPQKSIFIDVMKDEVEALDEDLKIVWVCGKPDADTKEISGDANSKWFNYLTSGELNRYMAESNTIVSRSGYSTIMDLAQMGKKAIFIPTPGQTEQVYLAQRLLKNKTAFYMPQSTFDLQKALKEAEKLKGFSTFEHDEGLLTSAIRSIL